MTNERMKNGNIRYTNHRLIPLENDLINLFILNGGPFAFVFMHLIQVHTNRHFNALYSDLIARALNITYTHIGPHLIATEEFHSLELSINP